jgi:hypothetical protein
MPSPRRILPRKRDDDLILVPLDEIDAKASFAVSMS